MPNGTYGGVRGRKTKVGRKLLRFPPTRLERLERVVVHAVPVGGGGEAEGAVGGRAVAATLMLKVACIAVMILCCYTLVVFCPCRSAGTCVCRFGMTLQRKHFLSVGPFFT